MIGIERLEQEWEHFRQDLKARGATDAEIDALLARMVRLYTRHRYADATRALGRLYRRLLDREPPTPEPHLFA